jgi:hypothetical protein
VTLREALQAAIKIADEAREEWDKAPAGMRAGKLLIALSGHLKGYRPDIDAIHAALATQPEPEEEVAFWRRDAIARLQMAVWLHRGCEQSGDEVRAAQARIDMRATLAALRDADAQEWYERCEACGEFLRDGEARVNLGEDAGAAHAKCVGEDSRFIEKDDDATAIIAEARALLEEPEQAVAELEDYVAHSGGVITP